MSAPERPPAGQRGAERPAADQGASPRGSGRLRRAQRVQTLALDPLPSPALLRCLSPNGRAHWAARRAAAQRLTRLVWAASLAQPLHPAAPPVRITWRWIVPDRRRRDLDNHATGAVKVVLDALVSLGVLPDDAHTVVVAQTTEIVYRRGERRLEVEIEEVRRSG